MQRPDRTLDLDGITQGAVEQAVSAEYSASTSYSATGVASGAAPRVVRIEGWQAPDPTGDFVQAFPGFAGGGRRGRGYVGNEVAVTTEKIGPGRVAVFLVPNGQNKDPHIQQLARGTMKLKVGEAQL
jgi:hypothetical protein